MKNKTLLLCVSLVSVAASSAFAQAGAAGTTFSLTPSSQTVGSNSSFSVTLSLVGGAPPSQIGGFDLWLITASANSGLFSINSVNYSAGPFTLGSASTPDSFSTTATNTAFVRSNSNLGAIGQSSTDVINPPYNTALETLTINTKTLTPGQTYTFYTSTQATAGSFYSDVQNADGSANYTLQQASFTINAAVPEPTTWALVAVGAIVLVGGACQRRRQLA